MSPLIDAAPERFGFSNTIVRLNNGEGKNEEQEIKNFFKVHCSLLL
jgi:hypothetical protein